MPKARNSEVDAYAFIKEHLGIQGWVVKNPNRVPGGQVYTQTECLDHPEIKRFLDQQHPENVVKVSETDFYVIEAKRHKEQINQALKEAQNDYADKINRSKVIKARVISGVAGNSTDGFIVKSCYLKDGQFHPIKINGKEITGFVSPQIASVLFENNSAEIEDLPVDEKTFLRAAEEINKTLHIGAINKNQRARVMAALLLSLVDDTRPNVNASPRVFINEINSRADNILVRNKKQEFFECIKIALPPSEDNHFKFKNALVQTMQELENLNIRSAMNSGTDVLGKFYEVFLKYGNGAKEIGIVLTPRHITRFAAEILDVTSKDIAYDPTAGTGGFLVAAYDKASRNARKDDIEYFKNNGLYGIEQEPEVAALAIVNMIFRGDGKNNIIEGNCFTKSLCSKTRNGKLSAYFCNNSDLPAVRTAPATRILMNPPFALKKSDEKEYRFVQHALEQMQDEGLLFSVLPFSVLIEQGQEREWRKNELLKNNTLMAVITFPQELFYPIGVNSLGIIVKKGIPHDYRNKVLWLRAMRDGFVKVKGKRLEAVKEPNLFKEYLETVKDFIQGKTIKDVSVPEVFAIKALNENDTLVELVPEAHIDSKKPNVDDIQVLMDKQLREVACYMIRFERDKA
ncbi:MAG: N-6 DNA methylase [Thermodesulfobacteriota bacterium]|jgi:type I restriction-modification system DNA methylase subunit